MVKHTHLLGFTAGLALMASAAMADSIDPEVYEATLNVGESVTIKKTVTVEEGTPTTSRADVFFLVDTSGSMGGTISAAQTFAGGIVAATSGLGDIGWGVGSYEDVPVRPWGSASSGDLPWRLNQAITTDLAEVQAGVDDLALRFGADFPESNLIALSQAATEAGWRPGAQKFIIWFGDAPGHDPSDGAPVATGSGADGLGGTVNVGDPYPGPTLAQTIDTLTGEMITVIGLDSGSLDFTGQATAITDATGGLLSSIASSPGEDIVDLILDSLTTAFETYTTVSLSPEGVPAGVGVEVSDPIVGEFDREETREFHFEVTFTGLEPGEHVFTIDALVDGGVVATEKDVIRVPETGVIPLPAAGWLLLGGLGALGALSRRRRKAA